jgi:D-amino-acid dehydrogenase
MDIAGSVHFPMDCHLTTDRFMAALQTEIERLGVRFIWNREIKDARIESGRRIRAIQCSDGQEIESDELVLCGGSWSPELARKLGLRIPMQAGKGYSLTLPKPRQLPQICSICTEARVAVTPMDGALRVGGTMEIAGLNEDINPVRVRGIIDSFCRYFPDFRPKDFDGLQPWRGLRPCSPDGLPYVGRTVKFANLSIATGHGMMGLSLGPVTGRLMAEILSGEEPAWDIAMLSPDRYD